MQRLRMGSTGPEVRRLQQELNRLRDSPSHPLALQLKTPLTADGVFGQKTLAAVTAFQRSNGISSDGIVGAHTWFLLLPYIAFRGSLKGRGRFRPAGTAKALVAAPGGERGGPTAGDGLWPKKFEGEVGAGLKLELRPWYPFSIPESEESAVWSQSFDFSGLILRSPRYEVNAGFEISKSISRSGDSWAWEGSVEGSYKGLPDIGIWSPFQPKAKFFLQGGEGISAGVSVGGETSLEIVKDRLDLTVGAEGGFVYSPSEGELKVGGEVSAGLKFKFQVGPF